MKITDFIQLLIEEIEIEDTNISPETHLDTIEEWDSMATMILIAIARNNFDTKLTQDEIKEYKTIHDIAIGLDIVNFE